MPRLLIVSKFPPFFAGGAERFDLDIGSGLAERSWEVHYLTLVPSSGEEIPEIKNVEFHFIDAPASVWNIVFAYLSPKGLKKYREVAARILPDLVLDSASPIPVYLIHFLDSAFPKCILIHAVFREQALRIFRSSLWGIGVWASEYLYKFLPDTPVIVNSQSTKKRFEKLTGRSGAPVLNPCVHLEEITPNIAEKSTFVLYLARLDKRKNVETLLAAWKLLDVDIPLIIAGDGPNREGLISLAQKHRLRNVEFLGYVEEEEKKRLYQEACLYVLPTAYEGFGISVLEAMAYGKPVVTTNTWGVKDFVRDGENGLLAEPGNPLSLAEKIEKALSDRELRLRMAREGILTAQRYDCNHMVDKALAVLKEILEGARGVK